MLKKNPSVTTKLLGYLKNEQNIRRFLAQNESDFVSQNIASFFEEKMLKYKLDKSEIILRADIDRSYGYQILRGARYASRDNYLKIAIGMGLDLTDTQLLLNITQTSPLYVRVKRDAVIIYCIENHYTLRAAQELLYNLNSKILE